MQQAAGLLVPIKCNSVLSSDVMYADELTSFYIYFRR